MPLTMADLTPDRIQDLTPLVREVIRKHAEAWDALSALEHVVGVEIPPDHLTPLIILAPTPGQLQESVTDRTIRELLTSCLEAAYPDAPASLAHSH